MTAPRGKALIVTLGRSRGSLAAARALSRAGWEVGIGTPSGDGMVAASRACGRTHVVPRPRGDGAAFIEGVRTAVEQDGYDVVFGGADDWMAALSTYAERLPVTVAHPAADVVAKALDKVELGRLAAAAGLAAPRTAVADDDTIAGWDGPVVVKCRSHWFPGQERGPRIEARRYPEIGRARRRIDTIRRAGFDAILQAPVEGQLSALIGLFHEGRLLGRVQQVATGLWPTPSGVSSRAVSVAVDDDLAARCEQLLGELGWRGLVELQFLTDHDGRPWLIDLNGRFYGSMALANAAGPNLADAWACQVLGRPLPAVPDGRPGVRYLWTAGDLRRAARERRGGLVADVWSALRLLPVSQTSVWDVGDPGPAVELLLARSKRMLRVLRR